MEAGKRRRRSSCVRSWPERAYVCGRFVSGLWAALFRIGKDVLPMTEEEKAKIEAQNMEFSRGGLRVLAFAYREIEGDRAITLEDENDLTFLGLVSMMDPREKNLKQQLKNVSRQESSRS